MYNFYELGGLNMDKMTNTEMKIFHDKINLLMSFPYVASSALPMLGILQEEVKDMNKRLRREQISLDKELPFNLTANQYVDWESWDEKFDQAVLFPMFEAWEDAIMRNVNQGANNIPDFQEKWDKLKAGFLFELRQLRMYVYRIYGKMEEPEDYLIERFMQARESHYRKYKEEVNPIERANKECAYRLLLKSKFIRVGVNLCSDNNYMQHAEDVWKRLLDENGNLDTIKVGRYIFSHRDKLDDFKLYEYFEYTEFLVEKTTVEKTVEETIVEPAEQPNVLLSNRIFKTMYSSSDGNGSDSMKPINLELLHQVIRDKCLPLITYQYQWFCLWRVLNDYKLFKGRITQGLFVKQMQEWYSKENCSPNCLRDYIPTHLGKVSRKKWTEESYIKSLKTNSHANPENFETMKNICIEMENVLEDFVEKTMSA